MKFEDLKMTGREELGLGVERRDPIGEDGMQASDCDDCEDCEDSRGCEDCPPDECTGRCMSCYYRPV